MIDGRQQWFIWNETTTGENFAEKWNDDPRRAQSLLSPGMGAPWQTSSGSWPLDGLDNLDEVAQRVVRSRSGQSSNGAPHARHFIARAAGQLAVAPVVGSVISQPVGGHDDAANTFFGAK